jgi:hypothetical protein
MTPSYDSPKRSRNRGVGRDGSAALTSGRWGSVGGQKARSFHCNIGSVTKARPIGKGASIDYLDRTGAYAGKGEELEEVGGRSPADMREILTAVDAGTRRKNGRIAVSIVIELPVELPPARRKAVMDGLADELERRGYPAHWAIHRDPQPHGHLVTTPRRVIDGQVEPEGTRGAPIERLFGQRADVIWVRELAADLVNRELGAAGIDHRWHPGRLKDTGIDRPAQKRVPERAYHREGQRERDLRAVEAAKTRREREKAAREERAAQRATRAAERAREKGLVPASELAQADRIADRNALAAETAWAEVRELRARPVQTVEVIREVQVKIEPAEEQRPATIKALRYMLDLAAQKGAELVEDAPTTTGTVGATIKALQAMPDAAPRQDVRNPVQQAPTPPQAPAKGLSAMTPAERRTELLRRQQVERAAKAGTAKKGPGHGYGD